MIVINEKIVAKFHGELEKVINAELIAGNIIVETWSGNWPYDNVDVVSLQFPFRTPIKNDIVNIDFHDINDPHFWKAEYYDHENNLLLICKFGK